MNPYKASFMCHYIKDVRHYMGDVINKGKTQAKGFRLDHIFIYTRGKGISEVLQSIKNTKHKRSEYHDPR